jgi:hypothetical protein
VARDRRARERAALIDTAAKGGLVAGAQGGLEGVGRGRPSPRATERERACKGIPVSLAKSPGRARRRSSECRYTEVVDKDACRRLSVVAHHRQPGAVSAAVADPECERIAAAPPANDRDGMYTGPKIEPAGGQEPARTRQ